MRYNEEVLKNGGFDREISMGQEHLTGTRSAARRRIGDFGQFADDGGLTQCVRQLLLAHTFGLWILYIRRSQETSEEEHDTANYLVRQEMLFDRLVALGVPRERIIVLDGDTGKSGSYTMRERSDMAKLYEALDTDEPEKRVAVVVTIEISRLHRNSNLVEPTQFASRMARHGTRVLTTNERGWTILNMEEDSAYDTYLNAAKHAAKERHVIRLRSVAARETAVENGAWSGSSTPLGWRAEGKKSKWETPEGKERRPTLYVYEPHRLVKLEIMRASLLPHIKTISDLRSHMLLKPERFTFPPFEPEIRGEAFRNSILPSTRVKDAASLKPRQPHPDEPYFPYGKRVIEGILIETMAIGDVRFGTGERAGVSILRKAEERAKQDDSKIDSMVRDFRPLVRRGDQSVAVCRTPEEIALYEEVVKKWSRYDLLAARETEYTEKFDNPHSAPRKQGRPSGSGATASPWSGVLFCYHHGVEPATGEFSQIRRFWRQGTALACSQDRRNSGQATCALIYDLEEILARHLLNTIAHLLLNTEGTLDRLQAEREAAKRRAAQLDLEFDTLTAQRKKATAALLTMVMTLDDSDEETTRTATAEFTVSHIKPLTNAITANRKEAKAAHETVLSAPQTESTEEIKSELRDAVVNWDGYTLDRRRELVATFVDSIGVLVPDGSGTVIIEWHWSPRVILGEQGNPVQDILITWRNRICDSRPWTEDENEALRRLWPSKSGADRDEILASLQRGRGFSAIQRRVGELKIAGAKRSVAWRAAWREWERTYCESHPDVMYFHVLNCKRGAAALVRQITRDWNEQRWGPEGDWRNEILCRVVRRDDPLIEQEKSMDDFTDEDADLEVFGSSVTYQVKSTAGQPAYRSESKHFPILLPDTDRESILELCRYARWEADEIERKKQKDSQLNKNEPFSN